MCGRHTKAKLRYFRGWLTRQRPAPSFLRSSRAYRLRLPREAEARQADAIRSWMKPPCLEPSTSTAAFTERHHCSGALLALAKLRSEPTTNPSQLQTLGRTWHEARIEPGEIKPMRVSAPFTVGRCAATLCTMYVQ